MRKKKRGILYLRSHSGQVWIETVIYTLIAFVMIGLVLSFAKPKIEEMQDKAILQQSTEMLKEIDSTILTMGTAGNQRLLEIGIKKGVFRIDGSIGEDKLVFELETKSVYSEPDKEINDGSITIMTKKASGYNIVTLTRDYSDSYDIRVDGADDIKEITKGSVPYRLSILNEGGSATGKIVMNMLLD